MPIDWPFDVQVQLQAVQAAFEGNAWSENPVAHPFFYWALLYISAASGCRFWDLNGGIRAPAAIPGKFPRNACAMKQYVVVGVDVLRLFQNAHPRFPDPEKDPFSLAGPCDLIFTSVGSLGWMAVSIDSTRKAIVWTPEQPVLASVATAGNSVQYDRFKRHLKNGLKQLGVTIAGNILQKKLNATVATISMGIRSSDSGSGSEDSGLDAVNTPQHEAYSLHLARTISVVCGGLRAPTPPGKSVALIRAWILNRPLCFSDVSVPPAAKAASGPTGSGGGASGPDVTGGGGGGADRGGGSENSNSKGSAADGSQESGGCGTSGTEVH
jgi:hypothetical protein